MKSSNIPEQNLKKENFFSKNAGCLSKLIVYPPLIAIIFFGLYILLGMFIAIFSGDSGDNADVNNNVSDSAIISNAEQFVISYLRSPSTADFDWDTKVTEISSNTFIVRGFVEAENSFGAKIRSRYYVKLKYDSDFKKYELLDISIE